MSNTAWESGHPQPACPNLECWRCLRHSLTYGPGVNGAGKTTQLQIITGQLQPDGGEVIKARANMKIAHLTQEFNVVPSRTVR